MDDNIIVQFYRNGIKNSIPEGMIRFMSISLPVNLSKDYASKYKKCTPSMAIAEFIWNSLDADANNIFVNFIRSQFGEIETIEAIEISDDGHGIQYDILQDTFGQFGTTYKKYKIKSPGGRAYHGKQGHGRYKGFSLGKRVTWKSNYNDSNNKQIYYFEIHGNESDSNKYVVVEPKISKEHGTGTNATIECINDECSCININKIITEQEIMFAPYLLAYPGINIVIDGMRLDPNKSIINVEDHNISIPADKDNEGIDATLKIIEWKTGKSKNRYLCNTEGMALTEEPSGLRGVLFAHTVYVLSDFFEKLMDQNMLEIREHFPNYNKLNNEIDKKLRKYYRRVLAQNAESVITELKNEGVYPYKEQARDEIEVAEREVFDICAANVNVYLSGFNGASKATKTFTLNLLKEAIEQNPTSMKKVLTEVMNLPKEKVDEFAELLEKTKLSSIISTTKMITNRIAFINGLEQILNEPFYNKKLKERSQLQKILLEELWIFGEQYTYGCDDVTLKNVLLQHIDIMGRNELAKEIKDEEIQGLNDIPDICLYRQYTSGRPDEFENLIIELKRPSVKLGLDELTQIRRYASTVSKTKYFDKEKTKWVFVIIGTALDDDAKSECNQTDRAYGLITRGDKYEVWVKEWNQVIQEAKGRHDFLRKKLEYTISDNSEGMKYLKDNYGQFLPEK